MYRRFNLQFILCCLLFVGHHCFVSSSYSNNNKETCVQVADDDVRLYTLEYGDSQSGTAPVILLLHGFPDLSLSWEYHAQQLAEEGYFVVTPDMRGFGSSSIPKGDLAAYSRQRLVSDIDSLRNHYCGEDGSFAMLVGHDWGGVVAWATLEALGRSTSSSADNPIIPIAKCAVLVNAPHPRIFSKHIYTLQQAVKSWYIFCFQLCWWPEFFLQHTKSLYYSRTKKEYQFLVESLEKTLVNGKSSSYSAEETAEEESTCSADENALPVDVKRNLAVFKKALTDRDRIHAMLSYYRAMTGGYWSSNEFRRDPSELSLVNRLVRWLHNTSGSNDDNGPARMEPITSDGAASERQQGNSSIVVSIPTMILWGKNDRFLGEELASVPDGLLEDFRGTKYFDAGHWVHWEKPQETVEELIHFANSHNAIQAE